MGHFNQHYLTQLPLVMTLNTDSTVTCFSQSVFSDKFTLHKMRDSKIGSVFLIKRSVTIVTKPILSTTLDVISLLQRVVLIYKGMEKLRKRPLISEELF